MITLEQSETGNLITPCDKCVFATWNQDTEWHKTQTGCHFDRINKFKHRRTKVEEVKGDDKDYFKIYTFCNYLRDQEWAENQEKKEFSDLVNAVENDNKIKYTGIIINEDKEDSIDLIKKSITSFLNEESKPEKILVILRDNFAKIVTEIRQWIDGKIPLFFTRLLNDDSGWQSQNQVANKCVGLYTIAVIAGTEVNGLYAKLNKWINDDCEIVMAATDEETILASNRLLFDIVGGNIPQLMWEKCKALIEENQDGAVGIIKGKDFVK